jgi:hypothetical protein
MVRSSSADSSMVSHLSSSLAVEVSLHPVGLCFFVGLAVTTAGPWYGMSAPTLSLFEHYIPFGGRRLMSRHYSGEVETESSSVNDCRPTSTMFLKQTVSIYVCMSGFFASLCPRTSQEPNRLGLRWSYR